VPCPRIVWLAAGLAGAAIGAGCGPGPVPYPQAINAEDPGARILAIRQAGERKDRSVVPLLVDRLEDEDEAVRFYAILALEKITGTRLGYDYAKPAYERLLAVKRWRAFLQQRPATRATTEPAGRGM